jgi:hypothetical protein
MSTSLNLIILETVNMYKYIIWNQIHAGFWKSVTWSHMSDWFLRTARDEKELKPGGSCVVI